MLALPPFETCQRGFLAWRVRNHQEWHFCPRPRRRHALGFAFHLAEVRRPGRIAEARCLVFCREIEQLFERTRLGLDAFVWIADLGEALWNCENGEVGGLAVWDLMPVKRSGHSGI